MQQIRDPERGSSIDSPVRWGVLGCGRIAASFVAGVADSRTGRVVAVGSRSLSKGAAFAAEHAGGAEAFGTYAGLLACEAVEAVYVATPHPLHLPAVLAAAAAGKHVMVEKPAGVSTAEVRAMVEACREADVFLMEAFKDRPHPVFQRLFDEVEGGALGRVHRVEAAFGFDFGEPEPEHRLFDPALGGGAILDVGTYPVAMARAIAGAAAGINSGPNASPREFQNPERLVGWLRRGPTGVDVSAGAELLFADSLSASVHCSLEAPAQWIRVHGGEASIEVCGPRPWHFGPERTGPHLKRTNRAGEVQEILVGYSGHLLSHEVDAAGEAIRAGKTEAAGRAMGHEDSIGQAETLDRWLAC